MTNGIADIQKAIGYQFQDQAVLQTALTHSSWTNEHQGAEHNERLEFLGDAVLEVHISEALYRLRPGEREGAMTRMRAEIVGERSLARLARSLGIGRMLAMGRGEESQGGRERDALLADAVEAVIGAVHLDGGFSASRKLVNRLFGPQLDKVDPAPKQKDNKTRLQEVTQALFKGLPSYIPLPAEGPEHAPIFSVRLELPDGEVFTAAGSTQKKAEQTAAAKALEALEHC